MNRMNITKVSRQAKLQKILSGISSQFSGVSSITLGGKQVLVSDLVKRIQTELDVITAVAKAKAAYGAEVQTERTTRASLSPTLRQLRSYVVGSFGDTQDSVQALEAFGYFPRKAVKLPAVEQVHAQEKAAATRKARGTLGPKAKAEIEGVVPAVTPAPAVTPKP